MLALSLLTLLAASEVPVVSVMYFDNDSNNAELEGMRKGLTDLLITDLVAWEGVRVVERTRLEEVLKELDFQQTKYVDKASAAKLGKVLNSTYLIYGSMILVRSKLTITARLVQSGNGEVLFTVKEQDETDKIFDMEQRLVNQIVAKIDSKLTANDQARRKVKVPNMETVVAYGRALELSDQGKIEEAQAAMRAVVSKSPSFLLGRERQAELLKVFEEYQKKKKDLIAGRIVELGKVIDEVLKAEPKFDSLNKAETERYLAMRMLKGRFLARVMKQFLSDREERFRVMRKGSEGKALLVMRDWAENQRRYMAEYARATRRLGTVNAGVTSPASFSFNPEEAERRLIVDSKIGEERITDYDLTTLARFVLEGRVSDGSPDHFTVAPTLGSVDLKESKAVNEAIDLEIKSQLARYAAGDKQGEWVATQLLRFRAEMLVYEGNIDAAIAAYQQVLDAFPTGKSATWVEEKIGGLLKGGVSELRDFEHYQAAIKTCDDMKIRQSLSLVRRRMLKSGLKALDEFAAEIEKACLPPTKRTVSAFAQMYGSLARDAVTHDDCERYQTFYRKYLEMNGSVSDMLTFAKRYPWCDLGPIKKDVTWLRAKLNDTRDFDRMTRHVVSVLSNDRSVLTISGNTDGPVVPGAQEESFDLRLERQKDGKYVCTSARWRQDDGKYIEGTCSVTLTKMTPNEDGPGFDEGEFDALFPKAYEMARGVMSDIKLSNGDFKVRRQ